MLILKDISLKYSLENGELVIFKNMNYKFSNTGLYSIVGESGKGKTSLLNIIASFNKDYEGEVKLDCNKNEVAFVFQNLNLLSHLDVIENVMLPLLLFNIPKKEAYRRSYLALKRVGLESEIKKRIDELSGGQRARVALSRALVVNSKIILADEPTGALDSLNSREIMSLLKDISKDHLVIVVTHNEKLAATFSDVILTIENYKLVNLKESKIVSKKRETDSLKVKLVSLKTSFFLAWSFLKNKLSKISLATVFSSICFSLILMTLSLINKGSDELISIGKDYYNYDVIEVSRKKEMKLDDSNVKIVRNVVLDEESNSYLKSNLTSEFDSFISLNMFICPYINYYKDSFISSSKVSFSSSFNSEDKIKEGEVSSFYNEVVCNSLFMKNENMKLGDTFTYKNDVKVETRFKEKTTVDLVHLNLDFKIVGVSKEKEILNRETVYYNYQEILSYLENIKLDEASKFINREFKLKERLFNYTYEYDRLLDSKSICKVSDPIELKTLVDSLDDTYKINSTALNMTEAMIDLIDSFSKVILVFIILALICSFFLEYVFIENIYREKTKELALYLSFNISKKSFFRLGVGQVIIFSILNLIYTSLFFIGLSYLGNYLIGLYELPPLFSLKVSPLFVILISCFIFCFSYFCGQIPLNKIYKSNLIDCLREKE